MFLEHALNPLDVVPGGKDVVVHQELLPVADPKRRFRFQRPQMDMGRPRLLLGGPVGGGQKAEHRHLGESFQIHVESSPFGAKSGLAAPPDREDGYSFETVTFPSMATLTNSLVSLWNEMSIIQITAHSPTVKKLSIR